MLQPSHPYTTTRKTIALTIWNVPTKWCLCFLIHCQVYQSFPSKEQASFNYMAALIPCTVILEPSSFLYCLQFKFEFCIKELMLWVTVLSQSSFCWLYRACPFWAEENIIYLISVLTIAWCPCVAFSWTVGCDPMNCSPPGYRLCPRNSPANNTGVGCHFLLHEFPESYSKFSMWTTVTEFVPILLLF